MDRVNKETRTQIMKKVKSTGSGIEERIRKELWKRGLRYRKNVKSLLGSPDLAFKNYKIVIFIDSCFWHGCNLHCRMPESNKDYWIKKISRNKERDLEVSKYYNENSWTLIRIWEHDVKNNIDEVINKISKDVVIIILSEYSRFRWT
ncbi:very short patch repair endonuclease [Brevibacillus borstelensis]